MYYDPITNLELVACLVGGLLWFQGIKNIIYILAERFGIEYRSYPPRRW